jgi:predicted nucleotidyltransferase
LVIKELIEDALISCKGVVGAAFCGSIIKNENNERSDIDVVVVYSVDKRKSVIETLQYLMARASFVHVPVEFIVVDDYLARMGGHGIFHSFYEHLAFSVKNKGIIKIDPRELIKPEINIIIETKNYISKKRSSIEKRYTTLLVESPNKYRYLEKIISAPVYVARKVLRCLDESALIDNDSKKTVAKQYTQYYAGTVQAEILKKVNELDLRYSSELRKHLLNPNKDSYQLLIKEIEEITPMVLDFLKINYQLVKDIN